MLPEKNYSDTCERVNVTQKMFFPETLYKVFDVQRNTEMFLLFLSPEETHFSILCNSVSAYKVA